MTPSLEAILAFERAHPEIGPARVRAVRAAFGIGVLTYSMALAKMLESDEPDRLDPITTARLRRRRAWLRARAGRRP